MPQRSPTKLTTSRNRALEIGTEAKNFTAGAEYCAQCGHPIGAGLPHSHYEPQTMQAPAGGAPIQGNPIK